MPCSDCRFGVIRFGNHEYFELARLGSDSNNFPVEGFFLFHYAIPVQYIHYIVFFLFLGVAHNAPTLPTLLKGGACRSECASANGGALRGTDRARYQQFPLWVASERGSYAVIKLLLEAKVNVNTYCSAISKR